MHVDLPHPDCPHRAVCLPTSAVIVTFFKICNEKISGELSKIRRKNLSQYSLIFQPVNATEKSRLITSAFFLLIQTTNLPFTKFCLIFERAGANNVQKTLLRQICLKNKEYFQHWRNFLETIALIRY